MSDTISGTDFRNAMTRHQRVTIAAALITSGAIDLTGVNFHEPEAAAGNANMQKLSKAVDAVLKAVSIVTR